MKTVYYILVAIAAMALGWGAVAVRYLNVGPISGIIPSDMAYIVFSSVLPALVILMAGAVAIIALMYSSSIKNIRIMTKMAGEMTAATESSASITRLAFSTHYFAALPFIMADMAESIAEIMRRAGVASEVVIFDAMSKPGENKLYAISAALAASSESTPHFSLELARAAKKDRDAAKAILAFVKKYKRMAATLKAYDPDGALSITMEEGAAGKAYAIITAAIEN